MNTNHINTDGPTVTAGKVVIVNDDTTQLRTLAVLLDHAGVESACFDSAESALHAMVSGGKPCLIVSDIYMPVIDGWRFCRLLRSDEYAFLNQVPILVVSATFAGDETEQIAADIGADAFLPCPVDGDEFLGVVKGLIEGQEPRRKIRALLVEDDTNYAIAIKRALQSADYDVVAVETLREAQNVFRNGYFDLAIVDENLPDGEGGALFSCGQKPSRHVGCAFIMISGNVAAGKYLEWMKEGASAILSKPFEVGYLLACCERARRERALLRTEELLEMRTQKLFRREDDYRLLVGGLPDAVIRFDRDFRCVYMSDNCEALLGIADASGRMLDSLPLPGELARFWHDAIGHVFDSAQPYETEFVLKRPQGDRFFNWRLIPEGTSEELSAKSEKKAMRSVLTLARDITQSRMNELRYRRLFREMRNGFAHHEIICNQAGEPIDYRFLTVNPAFERMTGKSAKEVIGRTVLDVFPQTEEIWIKRFGQVALSGVPDAFESVSKQIGNKWFAVNAYSPQPGEFAVMFNDVTAEKAHDAEREKLNVQLRQAQKMETVGRLAGGVAHDFNNMLSVILGNIELALDMLDESSDLRNCLKEAFDAAMRSAEVTRQLLAFSRRQTIAPVNLDINKQVRGILKVLNRLIGEGITLEHLPANDLGHVSMDPSQIDQILVNLCVNARDAFGDGKGNISIKTANCELDDQFCREHIGSQPGAYIQLQIQDTGCGMSQDVLDHLFEPFFTTKEGGKGTGLGLSTVYGIVKQNKGYVDVKSEIGVGTTMNVYLPRVATETQDAKSAEEQIVRLNASGETILIVEDEPSVRQICRAHLKPAGFVVHVASTVEEALQEVERMEMPPDIVLTDMMMPGDHTGLDLIRTLSGTCPDTEYILMSGYDGGLLQHKHEDLDCEIRLLQKPFTSKELIAEIHQIQEVREIRKAAEQEIPDLNRVGRNDSGARSSASSNIKHRLAKGVVDDAGDASEAINLLRVHSIESVGRLVGTLLHETNNQLMVMQWYADQALEHARQGIPTEEWLERILETSRESVKMTKRIMSRHMKKFSAEQDVLPKNIDLCQVIKALHAPLLRLVGTDVAVKFEIPHSRLPLHIDPAQIDQILVSLGMNAHDAVIGKKHPTIAFFAEETELSEDFFSDGETLSPGPYISFGVRDNGCGIPHEIREKIMEPFFTTKREQGSIGLGLTLVEGIVRQNDGYIRIASTTDESTCFSIYFPRAST